MYDHDSFADMYVWLLRVPFLSGLEAGKVELDDVLPEVVSEELTLSPVSSAQNPHHLWEGCIRSSNQQGVWGIRIQVSNV